MVNFGAAIYIAGSQITPKMTNPEVPNEIITSVHFTPEEYERHKAYASDELTTVADFIKTALEYYERGIEVQNEFFKSAITQTDQKNETGVSSTVLDEIGAVQITQNQPTRLSDYRRKK